MNFSKTNVKKRWGLGVLLFLLLLSFIFPLNNANASEVISSNDIGTHDGYDYEYWRDSGTGTMTLKEGGTFSCEWSNINNLLFRKGKKFDETQTHQQIGDISIEYAADYNPNGNSYLCVYGWTTDPLVEYYIVDSWGDWRPPGATSKGTIEVNGGTYDIYETTRTEQPSIEGTATFQQYWSVRRSKKTSGTISVSEHFEAWESTGMPMGNMYEVAFTVEGYQSSGQADITKNVLSIGGDTGGNDNENNDDDGNDDNDDNNGDTGEDNNQDPINTGEKFLGQIIASSIPSDFDNYWNQVTTENSCKWGSVESSRDNMNWDQADMAYDYAKENNMPFKFHVLVWGSQEPSWIGSLSQQEQKEEVLEWYQAVAERYPDIDMIDVVNEPLHAPASYRDAIGGSGSTGWDWIVWSFEQAREYFPNAELHLNDYGIIGDPNETENYVEIINILNDRGLIDAIGIQSHHFNMDTVTVSTMNQVLDMLAETELPIYVSELDITGDDNTQLERYQEKFPVLWEHPSVAGVTLWGWLEGHTWRENTHLIKSDGTNRPAFDWLMEYVDNNSGDNGDDDTGDNGDDDDSDSNPDEFDAFSSIEAEDYSSIDSEAIEVIGNNSGGESLGYIENGDSITFNNVDFGNGASTFTASIGTENQTASIEIRLDNSYGELLGTLQIDSTENWDSYEEQSTDISNVTGTNDLVLVFTGPVNFDWFTFSNEEGSGETGDVNNDGYIDSLDSTLLRRYLLGRVDDVNGDLDGDGGVYSTDYTLLRRYLTGSISSF